MPVDGPHKRDARTSHLATLSLIAGVISISLFPQFVCILLTRFAVVQLPESLVRIGFLASVIGLCLVPGFGTTAIALSAIALRRLRSHMLPQSARRARAGMILGILIIPAYGLSVILFFLALFIFQVEMV